MDWEGHMRWVLSFLTQFSLLRGLGTLLQVHVGATSPPPLSPSPPLLRPSTTQTNLCTILPNIPLSPQIITIFFPPPVLSQQHPALPALKPNSLPSLFQASGSVFLGLDSLYRPIEVCPWWYFFILFIHSLSMANLSSYPHLPLLCFQSSRNHWSCSLFCLCSLLLCVPTCTYPLFLSILPV